MMYIDFEAGNKAYKLRLTTGATVALEKRLGCNPIAIFGDGNTIPTVTTMVGVLHASLQAYQHNITMEDAYNIFDEWLEDGHSMTDFFTVIIDVFKASGLMRNGKDAEEKNV